MGLSDTNSVALPGSPSAPILPVTNPDGKTTFPNAILQWLTEKLQEGEAFLAAQSGYDKIAKSIDVIMSNDDGEVFDPRSKLSQTRINIISRIAEDIAALLTDTKPFWDYSVANRRFEQHAQIYSKLATFWYQNRNIDLVLGDVIKYYVAAGTGYLHLYWNPDIQDIDACAEDPRNVIPISPNNYKSLEDCMGVIIKKKVPVTYVEERYGINVKADSDGSAMSWLNKLRDSTSDMVSPIWKFRKSGKAEPELPRIPTVTIYTCYLKDYRTHDGKTPKQMGQFEDGKPVNQWSYVVQPGQRLYPHLRMISWCGGKIIYDGPGFYWHDNFPIIKLTLNPYPWSFLGKGPVWDLLRLQTSLNQLLRVVDDHAAQVAQPGAIMDKRNVSQSTYDSFDTRRAGWKIKQNPEAGNGVQIVNPPPLDAGIWTQINFLIDQMQEGAGIKNISRMMDLKQIPENSTVEAIVNQMTPGLRLRSRIMEAFARNVARQMAFNFTEFYTLPIRVAILGPGGITQDDFDFDPGSLLPDFVHLKDYVTKPDENNNLQTSLTPEAFLRGPLPKYERAQEFLRGIIFKISPASLLNGAQMERTLVYFQLVRAGVMDPITLMEQLGIPNIGVEQIPDNVRTIIDRVKWCQANGLMMQVNPAGAKASAQSPPRIVTKES